MSSTVPHDMVLNSFTLHGNHVGIDATMISVVDKGEQAPGGLIFCPRSPRK